MYRDQKPVYAKDVMLVYALFQNICGVLFFFTAQMHCERNVSTIEDIFGQYRDSACNCF